MRTVDIKAQVGVKLQSFREKKGWSPYEGRRPGHIGEPNDRSRPELRSLCGEDEDSRPRRSARLERKQAASPLVTDGAKPPRSKPHRRPASDE